MGSARDTGEGGDGARDSRGTGEYQSQKVTMAYGHGWCEPVACGLHTPASVGLCFDGTSLGHPEAPLIHLPASRPSHGEH